MKININRNNILIAIAILIVGAIVFFGVKSAIHDQKIQQASTKQVALYKEKLIPALMADYKDYKIENVSCNEINPEGQCDYAIKIDCNIRLGEDKYNFPVIVLFNNSDIDNPKYQYSKEATNDINSKITVLQKEANDKKIVNDYVNIVRNLLMNDTLTIPDAYVSETSADNNNVKAYIITSSMIIPNSGLGNPKYHPIKMKLQYDKNGVYTYKISKTN